MFGNNLQDITKYMRKKKTIVRYVVKDNRGSYINSYNTGLGVNKSYSYAKECARLTKGIVWEQDVEGIERIVYDNSK